MTKPISIKDIKKYIEENCTNGCEFIKQTKIDRKLKLNKCNK